MNSNFAKRLKEARGNRSQADICALIGVKQGTYSTWEIGKYQPPYDKLTSIARVTGRSIDWLLGHETIGDRIRRAREAIGITVKDLASKLNVTDAYVTGVENGINPVDIKSGLIQMFAKELGMTPECLLEGIPIPAGTGTGNPITSQCVECNRKDVLIEKLVESVNLLSSQLEKGKHKCKMQK